MRDRTRRNARTNIILAIIPYYLNDVVFLLEGLPQLRDGIGLLLSTPLSPRFRLFQLKLLPIQVSRQLKNTTVQIRLLFLFLFVQGLEEGGKRERFGLSRTDKD